MYPRGIFPWYHNSISYEFLIVYCSTQNTCLQMKVSLYSYIAPVSVINELCGHPPINYISLGRQYTQLIMEACTTSSYRSMTRGHRAQSYRSVFCTVMNADQVLRRQFVESLSTKHSTQHVLPLSWTLQAFVINNNVRIMSVYQICEDVLLGFIRGFVFGLKLQNSYPSYYTCDFKQSVMLLSTS